MPRVHYVKAARKDNRVAKKGEPYYWWKFRHGGKQMSKERPRQSQLTQSDKLSRIYAAQESVEDITMPDPSDFEDKSELAEALREAKSTWEDAIQELRDVAEEYRESAQNMEEYFPNGSMQIDEINEKADQVESDADEADTLIEAFDNAADEIDSYEPDEDDEDAETWQDFAQSQIDDLPTSLDVNV